MEKNEKVVHIIYEAIDDVNQLLPKEQKLEKSPDTILFGKSVKIDSLGMVNLIVAIEGKIEESFNAVISLIEGMNDSHENNYFKNVGSLAEHINNMLNEN